MATFDCFPTAEVHRSYRLQTLLQGLPKLTFYNSKLFATTTHSPVPSFVPNRLNNLLSELPKLTVIVSELFLTTFTLFPNLPFELRAKIWSYASRHPRVLLLTDNWHPKAKNRESIENHNKVPAVLHTCSEARKEGLKHYTACTKRCSPHAPVHDGSGHRLHWFLCAAKKVYVNFAVDHFLRRTYENDCIPIGKLQLEVRDLAKIQLVDLPAGQYNWNNQVSTLDFFRLLDNLRELNLLVDFNTARRQIDKEPLMQDLFARQVGKERVSRIWHFGPKLFPEIPDPSTTEGQAGYRFLSRDYEELDPIPTHADFTS